jgi:tripartite-type tricarboxylate transporter receptor subunit TctC
MGGSVDYCIETFAATAPMFRQGQLRALGCSLAKGTYLDPSIPAFATGANMPGFDLGAWGGLMVPARTPQPIVARLAEAMVEMMRRPDIRESFDRLGAEVDYRPGEAFATLLRQQKDIFGAVVRAANIKPD